LVTSKLLHFLTPSKYLELGHRARPSRQAWGRLLDKIEARMKSRDAPMVRIAVFGAGSTNCNLVEPGKDPGSSEMKYDIDCLWPIRLEVFLNNILNHYSPPSERRAIVNVHPMYSPGLPVTAEFATSIIQNRLWSRQLVYTDGPDVILTAFNAHNMYLPKRGWKTAEDIDYYHHQRQVIQRYIRSALQLKRCNNPKKQRDPPIVISVDNYVGDQHGYVMADNIQARVLQLLSDYYETAFVSYAEVIRKLVYASDQNRSPLLHTSLKDWTGDWQSIAEQANNNNNNIQNTIEHGFLGPIAMTLTLAYSMLRYTVSYCQDKTDAEPMDYSIIPEAVFKLSEEVPPPELNTDLTLSNITELWRKEQTTQSNLDMYCTTNPELRSAPCAFAFTGGTHKSADLESYIKNHAKLEGWEAGRGQLTATQNGASMHFTFNILPDPKKWRITIFSARRDSQTSPKTQLQWTLSNNKNSATRRRLQQQQSPSSGIIEGTHDSPSTMVLPTHIPVSQELLNDEIHFDLKLIEGDTFEILAILFCSEDN
jgi:hypothetical protein